MKNPFLLSLLLVLTLTTELFADSCDEVMIPKSGTDLAALAQCRQLAEAGNAYDQLNYGLLLFGRLPEEYRDRPEGIRWIRKSAEKGNHVARVAMAMFLSGRNEDPDTEFVDNIEAYAWYAVLDDKAAMKRVAEKLTDEELGKARSLAEQYIEKYGREKWTTQ